MNPYYGIEKKLDTVASAVKSLDKTSAKTSKEQARERKRIPFDVDLLTGEEIDSLRQLVEHENDILAYSESQIKLKGDSVRGMYTEFDRLNLVIQEIGGRCAAILPMAHWAVEKYEQKERDVKRDRAEQWRHDIVVALLSTTVGGILGIVGTALGFLFG